jgi:hypothetical protein
LKDVIFSICLGPSSDGTDDDDDDDDDDYHAKSSEHRISNGRNYHNEGEL